MKIIRTVIILGLFCLAGFTACNDYLNVQPKDKFVEPEVYSTSSGIQNALNGIYLDISTPSLYGQNLSMGALDVMAQYYNLSDSRNPYNTYANYSYDDASVRSTFDNVWTSAYVAILDANKFIEQMKNYPDAITKKKADLLRGEATGLRAMLHFDMLRLFGPVYSQNPSAVSIPYYTKAQPQANDLLPANEVIKKVLADLKDAENLLKDDPIIANGTETSLNNTPDDFYRFRNRRMNYYAVKALEARVNLYAGNKSEALAAATSVIDEAQKHFPWVKPENILAAGGSPDRVFSKEIIFGIENQAMYDQQKNLFSADLQVTDILAPLDSRLESTYEANENDYRYNPLWKIASSSGKSYRTFYKFADVGDVQWRYFQPLIRISEMYYIAAETEADAGKALDYLNTVRFHRGLEELPPSVDLEDEIQKEYKKEFYGEGQLFFFYKRKNLPYISSGSSPYYNAVPQYILPLPDSETEFRN